MLRFEGMRSAQVFLAMWLGVTACAVRASAQDFSDPGICARCHVTETSLALDNGGHAPRLDCPVCHEDRRPGRVGHRHRTIPTSCTSHHEATVVTHPEPARSLKPARLRRRCLTCHDPHGSTNAHLVRPAILFQSRLRPVAFVDAGGAVPGGFVDPVQPGKGLCETCHTSTKFYRADGTGQPHFTDDCSICHAHADAFHPVIDNDASCTVCHADEGTRLEKQSLHHDRFTGRCSACHAEVKTEPGPGHRAVSACADCHSPDLVPSHMPGVAIACTSCHEPHGSDNIRLIRDVVRTPQGADRPIHFATLDGRVDGSFASVSAPGTGLCEVCHTRTQFYRADGSGTAHYEIPCGQCHPHETGFAPR
jgi:predicted CXXCH cytochrome family protein